MERILHLAHVYTMLSALRRLRQRTVLMCNLAGQQRARGQCKGLCKPMIGVPTNLCFCTVHLLIVWSLHLPNLMRSLNGSLRSHSLIADNHAISRGAWSPGPFERSSSDPTAHDGSREAHVILSLMPTLSPSHFPTDRMSAALVAPAGDLSHHKRSRGSRWGGLESATIDAPANEEPRATSPGTRKRHARMASGRSSPESTQVPHPAPARRADGRPAPMTATVRPPSPSPPPLPSSNVHPITA